MLAYTWKTDYSSCKLNYQIAGPYCIIKQINNVYKLDLLALIHMHSVFSSDKLWKAVTNFFSDQIKNSSLAIKINKEYKWEVEEILAVCLY